MSIIMKPGLKNPLMRATNFLLYLSFCGLAGTGALLTWRLVPGSRGGRGLSVLGMGRHDWGDIHFWLGAVFIATTVAHLLLNWQWLKKIASKSHAWRLWLGLGIGVAIIVGVYMLPMKGVVGDGNSHGDAVEEAHHH